MTDYATFRSRKERIQERNEYYTVQINDIDRIRARKLCSQLFKDHRISATRRPIMSKWYWHFHELNLELDFDGARLDRVLDWYCQNSTNKFTPIVFSADMFHRKFYQIEMAMERAQRDSGQSVVITNHARKLAKSLEDLNWPKNFASKLPIAVQISLDNYQAFVKTLLQKVKPKNFRRYILDNHLVDAKQFIRRWFEDAHVRVSAWPDWSGSPKSIIFRVDAAPFERMFYDWCRDYTTDKSLIYETLKAIQNA